MTDDINIRAERAAGNIPSPRKAGPLKRCPFCDGEASADGRIDFRAPLPDSRWEDGTEITQAFYVNCMKCGAVSRSGIVGGYRTRDEAIAAWNRRPLEDKMAHALRFYADEQRWTMTGAGVTPAINDRGHRARVLIVQIDAAVPTGEPA